MHPLSKNVVSASEYCYTCVNVLLFIFLHEFITGNCFLIEFNFSIKVPVTKKALWLLIMVCVLLNMSPFCIAAFYTQGPGNQSICLSGQNILATIFAMKIQAENITKHHTSELKRQTDHGQTELSEMLVKRMY